MNDKSTIKLVLIIGATLVAIFLTTNYFALQREITVQDKETERVIVVEEEQTERALKVEDKETERVKSIQAEKTSRTEERSKFWNKLVPWNDEAPDFTELGEQE